VLGISADSRPTLAAYTLSLGPFLSYPIPLLSDFHPHGRMIRSYGLFDEAKGTSFRAVVIVDKDGIVRFKRTYTTVLKSGPTGQGEVETDLDPINILAEVDKMQSASNTRSDP